MERQFWGRTFESLQVQHRPFIAGNQDSDRANTPPEFTPVRTSGDRTRPHLWQTGWFQILVAGAFAGLVCGAWRYRNQQLRSVAQLRIRIADDLHDEVGSNLSNIALLSSLAMKSLPQDQPPPAELAEIRQVALQTASAVRDIVWFVNPEFDTLGEMIRHMEGVAGRTLRAIPFQFSADYDAPDQPLSLAVRSHFFFAYKELLHNIAKHSQATQVTIAVRQEKNVLQLFVHDNGVGYDPKAQSSGAGLKSFRRRLTELNGTWNITTSPGQGTRIWFQVALA